MHPRGSAVDVVSTAALASAFLAATPDDYDSLAPSLPFASSMNPRPFAEVSVAGDSDVRFGDDCPGGVGLGRT